MIDRPRIYCDSRRVTNSRMAFDLLGHEGKLILQLQQCPVVVNAILVEGVIA
jgi:hypothetical protein